MVIYKITNKRRFPWELSNKHEQTPVPEYKSIVVVSVVAAILCVTRQLLSDRHHDINPGECHRCNAKYAGHIHPIHTLDYMYLLQGHRRNNTI